MKKRMKKMAAAVLSAAMVASLGTATAINVSADEDITIGVSIWSSTDVLGSQCKKVIDKAADALGVNVCRPGPRIRAGYRIGRAALRSRL